MDETPLGRALRIQAEQPGAAFISKEWARRLGYRQRELERAKAEGVLAWRHRGVTLGNKGHDIHVDTIVDYLRTVDAAERGASPPSWYEAVVKGRPTRSRRRAA